MKKFIAMVLTLAMLFALAAPAFAATQDDTLVYSLKTDNSELAEGTNITYAQKDDVITVFCYVTADIADDWKGIETGQDQILYDTTFFELVPNSNQSASTSVQTSTPSESDSLKYVYFNWTSTLNVNKNEPKKLGSFQLKVIGTNGSGMITNNAYKAEDGSHVEYGKSKIDLKVIYGTGPVAVTGVSIDETVNLYVGGEQTLTATIIPDNATNTNVTWESSNTAVATIDESGKVTAVAEGTATITCTTADGGFTDTCVVTVSKKTPTVTGTLTADVTYGDTVSPDAINAAGVTVKDGDEIIEGSWAWKDTVTSYGNAAAEAKQLAAVFTPTNTAKYNTVDANVSVTVGKATLTPAVASVEDKQYDGDTTGTGTLSLTGAKNSQEPTASGTFTWTAADAGTDTVNVSDITLGTDWQTNYQLSATSLTNQAAGKSISKANQNPTVSATATLTRGGNMLDLSTLVTSGTYYGNLSFEIASGDAATLGQDGKTLTSDATETGEVKITVKAAGNNNYNEYTGASAITVTVQDKADADVTITGAPESKTYGDDSFTVSATASNAETNGTWTWSSSDESILKIIGGGNTATVTVQVMSANATGATLSAKYESDTTADTETTASIPVAQKPLTITDVAATDRDYEAGNATVTLTGGELVGVKSGDSIGFTLGTGKIEGASAGEGKTVTTNITLTGDKAANYTLTQPTDITVTINQLTPSYTVPTGLSALPGDTLADVTLPTGWTWKDAATTSVGSVGSNSFTAVYTLDDTTNYKTVEETVSIAVAKGTPIVDTAPTTTAVTYGDTVNNNVLSGGVVKYGDEMLKGTWAWKTGVESYGDATNGTPNTLKATFTPENSDRYESVEADVSVTVNKATPDYAAPTGLTATYGQTLTDVNIAANTGWSWMDSTTSVGNASASAKTFKAKFTPSDTTNYNTVENIDVSVTVNKATQNPGITATATLTKGGNTLDLSTLVTSGTYYGNLSFEITDGDAATLEVSPTLTSTNKLGTVKIVVMAEGDNNHEPYTSANDAITVTVVDKADAGVSFTGTVPMSKTYGDADFTLTADKTAAGTGTGTWTWTSSDENVLTVDNSGKVTVVGAGNATITAKYESSTTLGTASQNITVAPLPVTLGWYTDSAFTTPYTDNSFTYDSTAKTVYAKVTNAVGDDTVTVSAMTGNTATSANATGTTNTATATALGGGDAANYTLTGATATKLWKIAPLNISGATVTLGTALTYTGDEQTQAVASVVLTDPSLTLTSGTDYTVSGNKSTTVKTDGNYTLTVIGTGNFTGTATETWNIAKATDNEVSSLAISGWTYGSSANTPTATAKYGTPTYTYYTDEDCTTKTSTDDGALAAGGVPAYAGTYYVKADVAETANYNAASDKTSFTIAKADYVTTGITGKTIQVYFGKTDATTVTVGDINGTLPAGAAIKSVAESADANEIIGTITGAAFSLDQEPALTSADVGKTATLTVTVSSTNYNDFDVSVTVKLIGKVDVSGKMTLNIPSSVTYGSNYTITGKLDGAPTDFDYSYRVGGSTGEYTSGLPTDAGTYEIKAVYEDDTLESGAPGHTGTKTGTLTINPKELTISGVTATNRDYAADNTAIVLDVSSAQLNGVVGEDAVTLNMTGAVGSIQTANAGENKAVTVTGAALTGADKDNYTLTQPTGIKVTISKATPQYAAPTGLTATYGQTLANVDIANGNGTGSGTWSWVDSTTSVGDASASAKTFKAKFTPSDTTNYKTIENVDVGVTVNKASAPTIPDQAVSLKHTVTAEQSKSLAGLMPTGAGTLSYTKGNESKTGAVTVSSWDVSDAGLVTFTLTGGAAGNTVTLPVTITSTNYADSTVKVVITLTEKDTPTASASNYTATYTGSPVDVSAITKTASVPGTWAWKDGTQVTNVADSGVKTLVFTPNDTENYESVETSVTVTINKAKPTGTPSYTKITGSGKTLDDAALTVGTITPAGTIAWDKPATTAVSANTSYAWTFTPADSANYDTLTGTVTLWTQGGGDPGIITPPSPQTITVPVSGDDKTIHADATVSGTEAKLKIDTSKLNTVVDEDVKTGTVEIDLTGLNKNIASVVIPNSALKDITAAAVDPDNDTDSLALMLTDGTIEFDAKALESIAKQADGGDLKLVVDDTGVKDLKTAQVQALRDNTVLAVYDIYMTSNGKRITNFEGGTAEVTVRHKLAEGQKTEGLVVLYVADDGTKTSMPFVIEGNEVVFTVTHFSNYVITYDEDVAGYKLCPQDETCVYAKFTDADTKAWYHDGVHFCVENGYMQGVSLTEFDPAGTTTRAMIVTILWRMEGSPVANYAMSFKDVPTGQWYTEAIRWAQSTGVVEGYSDDAFGPEDVITREQLATILYRYAGYKGIDVSARSALAGFEDTSNISGWALDYVKWAVAVGMINGRTETTIVPKGDATRAEAACMIQRFCENILKK